MSENQNGWAEKMARHSLLILKMWFILSKIIPS